MKKNPIGIMLFTVYCVIMLLLLFGRPGYEPGLPYWEQIATHLNLVPLRTLRHFGGLLNSRHPSFVRTAFINLFGNVILFIPLGFFLPVAFPGLRKLWKTALCTLLVMGTVEVLQLLTLVGICDIDDLILNLTGSVIGYGVFAILRK